MTGCDTLYIEPTLHRCTCATGTRSILCRVHTCCAVFRRLDDRVTRTCTKQRGHDGEHRDD